MLIRFSFLLALSIFSFTKGKAQTANEHPRINWMSIEKADEMRRAQPRKILIDVYTEWCGWCKKMDKTTFEDPKVVEFINTHFYAVKLDAEQKEPITLGGKTYEFVGEGRRGYNQIAYELLQTRMSYPTTVFLDEGMNMIQPVAGYLEAADMLPILEYLATGAYKSTPWEDWLKKREG